METKTTTTPLTGENLPFIEQLYEQYLEDPASVDESWHGLFAEYLSEQDRAAHEAPRFKPRGLFAPVIGASAEADAQGAYVDRLDDTEIATPGKSTGFAANVDALVRAYRLHGHTAAEIDPLGLMRPETQPPLDPATYGLGQADMQAQVRCESLFGERMVTLDDVIRRLREVYCDKIAVEYQYISEPRSRQWLRRAIEREDYAELDGAGEQKRILERLIAADAFETFLHRKYLGAKRFSLTGGDALIPMLDALMEEAGESGVTEILVGMAHRGRLNILHNMMDKPAELMFSEFEKTPEPEKYVGSSDVKYHMGYSNDHKTTKGKTIHLSMAFNPSHLEFVNPVVEGRARAKQDRAGDAEARLRIMPLLLHGDAAFAGQGIVTETFNLSDLPAYHVGGTIHVVINNQVGFTTDPKDSRSTRYATSIAKMLEVPIFHVNGDDPEACVRVMKLAMRYRQQFHHDVVIDLVCYRRYGHNEADEPRFTQPTMYAVIDKLTPVRERYARQLVQQSVLSDDEVQALWDKRWARYEEAFEAVHGKPYPKKVDSLNGVWKQYRGGRYDREHGTDTTVPLKRLQELGQILATLPESHNAHRTIARIIQTRGKMAAGEQPLDWGMGEALAFASLLDEGTNVRMTGQDCIRGTFSHRHAAAWDVESGAMYWPARHIHDKQGRFEIYNSLLSEAAVVGFEYGYALDYPEALVIWEAQFGDFVNGAQVLIDQFINSGEDKWKRLSGLVMLLPHGYEGQGPEHSSARLERFLQLCAEDNMFVCNLTTPAQYFHCLRRQVHLKQRKPLIIMSPKSLLRSAHATSSMEELATGGFQHVIPDQRDLDASAVKRVILCSGKVYYDLLDYANEHGHTDTALVRVEQLYPLDAKALSAAVHSFEGAERLLWVQEEPRNMGSWHYILPELLELFGDKLKPTFVGRAASASPATGDPESHAFEQRALMREAFER